MDDTPLIDHFNHLTILAERATRWAVIIAALTLSSNLLLMGVIISTW